jgi:hypothetical protein
MLVQIELGKHANFKNVLLQEPECIVDTAGRGAKGAQRPGVAIADLRLASALCGNT